MCTRLFLLYYYLIIDEIYKTMLDNNVPKSLNNSIKEEKIYKTYLTVLNQNFDYVYPRVVTIKYFRAGKTTSFFVR